MYVFSETKRNVSDQFKQYSFIPGEFEQKLLQKVRFDVLGI